MVQLAAVNLAKPHQLLKEGTLHGEGLNLQLSSLREHVHSRVATIYVAQSSTHGQVALKVLFAPDVREPHDVRKEIRILSCLHHPHICSLYNAYLLELHYVLAMPFYERTLLHLLDDPSFVPAHNNAAFTQVAKCLIKQMASAVAYLEDEKIAHRDISPSNFLLSARGSIALTDFGVGYDPRNAGQEGTCNLQFELGTGAYRAPELLFGSRSYNPFALDRWALGASIASFFTTVGPARLPSPDSDEPQASTMFFSVAGRAGPIERSTLFEGGFSDFALIGSIFKTLGTPTIETWPEAKDLPDFGKFGYKAFIGPDLATILPNLPEDAKDARGAVELISSMLKYPFKDRLQATKALQHPWLADATDKAIDLHLEGIDWLSDT